MNPYCISILIVALKEKYIGTYLRSKKNVPPQISFWFLGSGSSSSINMFYHRIMCKNFGLHYKQYCNLGDPTWPYPSHLDGLVRIYLTGIIITLRITHLKFF